MFCFTCRKRNDLISEPPLSRDPEIGANNPAPSLGGGCRHSFVSCVYTHLAQALHRDGLGLDGPLQPRDLPTQLQVQPLDLQATVEWPNPCIPLLKP